MVSLIATPDAPSFPACALVAVLFTAAIVLLFWAFADD